jgi:nucleotide-binding universal stress UspA family protein
VWSALAVALAAAASMAGAIPLATRSAWGLGRDRMVPSLSGCAGTENGTPRSSLLATGVLVLAGIAALPCADILATASLLFALWSILMSVCVVKARRNRGDELRYGFAMPFFPALPLGAILAHGVLAGSLWRVSPAAWAIAGAWAVAGGLVYRFYSRSRVEPMVDEGLVVEATGAEADGRYRVMMAVASTDSALGLVGPAYLLCGAKNATVELLHMVPVPEHVPLADAESCTAAGREAIGETTLYLAPAFPLATTIRYCRNVGRGIVEAARERRADLLIMGWHGATRTRLFTLGSTVDPVIERAPCNVVIVKNCEQTRFGNVLVPIAGGANGAFALEVGTILADKAGGRVVAFNAGGTGGSGFDLGSFVEANRARCALPRERIVTKESKGRLAVWSILREAEDAREAYDLIVIGCTEGGLGGAWVRPSVPETVARLSRKPVILVKASDGIQSWIKRWFQLEFGAKGA